MNRNLFLCLLALCASCSPTAEDGQTSVSRVESPAAEVPLKRSSQGDPEEAERRNKAGMSHYKKGRFDRAVAEFEAAVEADPTYHWGHYNLACTLGIFHSRGYSCDYGDKSRITDHLKIFMQLKPDLREKMRKDADLTSARDTFLFQTLIGLSVTNTDDVTQILQRVSWYGPGHGARGPTSGVDFKAGGAVEFWAADFVTLERMSGASGRYSVKGNKVFLELKGTGGSQGKRVTGTLGPDGRLSLPGVAGVDSVFTDDPDDCSA